MRIAALYDIHGNLPALEAVLADVRAAAPDLVLVGGDVLPGPMPHEALALLSVFSRDVQVAGIRGNGDRVVLEARRGHLSAEVPAPLHDTIRWNAEALTPDDVAWLEALPPTRTIDHPRLGPILFCHATPRSDTELFTERTPEGRTVAAFDGVTSSLVVCGHTHMPFDRIIGARRVVNAGSVGMPFAAVGAEWLLIGDGIEHRHTAYDLASAAARICATAYPLREHFASHHVLAVPGAEAMFAAFER